MAELAPAHYRLEVERLRAKVAQREPMAVHWSDWQTMNNRVAILVCLDTAMLLLRSFLLLHLRTRLDARDRQAGVEPGAGPARPDRHAGLREVGQAGSAAGHPRTGLAGGRSGLCL